MNLIDVLFSRMLIVPEIDSQIQALSVAIPAAATVDATGLVSFQNSSGTALFPLQLPLYAGGVE